MSATEPRRIAGETGASALVLDLFAGPGGWDQGALPLGLCPVGVEWDDAACRTGKAAGHTRVRADVAALPTAPMVGKIAGLIASPPCQTFSMAGKGAGRDALPELQDAVEKVWNGATPAEVCPADLDVKSVLVLEPVRYARDLRPEWIALEQVPAVLPIWRAFAVVLRHHGYSAWCGVLNSADYGVPQTRQRAILIASRIRKVQPPPPTHTRGGEEPDLFGDQLLPWVSMAAALGWGMGDRPYFAVAGGTAAGGADPAMVGGSGARASLKSRRDSDAWIEKEGERRNREVTEPAPTMTGEAHRWQWDGVEYVNGTQENAARRPATEPAPTVMFGHRSNDVRWVVRTGNNSMVTGRTGSRAGDGDVQPYERDVDEPAPTIDCGAGSKWSVVPKGLKPGQERWLTDPATTILSGHNRSTSELPNGGDADSVRVTVEEAAVLQSFPPDYPWQGSRTKQFEQVGNAVPPGLALHVLCAVLGVPVPAIEAVAA